MTSTIAETAANMTRGTVTGTPSPRSSIASISNPTMANGRALPSRGNEARLDTQLHEPKSSLGGEQINFRNSAVVNLNVFL